MEEHSDFDAEMNHKMNPTWNLKQRRNGMRGEINPLLSMRMSETCAVPSLCCTRRKKKWNRIHWNEIRRKKLFEKAQKKVYKVRDGEKNIECTWTHLINRRCFCDGFTRSFHIHVFWSWYHDWWVRGNAQNQSQKDFFLSVYWLNPFQLIGSFCSLHWNTNNLG